MDRVYLWLGLLAGSWAFIATCILMLGQDARPISHLIKATTFWYLVTWVGVVAIFLLVGL